MFGWYAYAFAAEPFVVSAVATYVPLFLESLARENAVLASDHRSPCLIPGDAPGLLPAPIAPPKCVVKFGYVWIDTSSLPLYTFSISVAVQTLLVISVSGIADRSYRSRKYLLIGFAIVGSVATIILASSSKIHYYLAAFLAVIGNASFGAVTVCGNAYIPGLAAQAVAKSPINYGAAHQPSLSTLKSQYARRISANGSAIGYASALFVQVVTMAMLIEGGQDNPRRLRIVIMLIGFWWLLGQIGVALFLNFEETEEEPQEERSLWRNLCSGWIGLEQTIQKAAQLQDITTFLIGWFLLSDAVTTINSTAVLFARTNLQMATPELALIGLITVVFAISGSLICARRANSLVSIALLAAVIPCYGILGFFQKYIGLRNAWELYALASWYGFMLGSLNAVTRSMYSVLIPKGHEVMFFALYAVTDKGSSILGPSVTGMITDYTHNIRYTFYFLLGMMLLAAFVFSHVDYERGQNDAITAEENISASETASSEGTV